MPAPDARSINAQVRAIMRETGQRRVYVLPRSMVDGIQRYQLKELLPSETAAFRELIVFALTKAGH